MNEPLKLYHSATSPNSRRVRMFVAEKGVALSLLRDRPWPVFEHGMPRNWIAADVVRVSAGVLAEHWDVLQDEVTEAEAKSGQPMLGTKFPLPNPNVRRKPS